MRTEIDPCTETTQRPTEARYATQNGFMTTPPEAESLHPASPECNFTASETSYLGSSIPEAGTDCMIYHWCHPDLKVMSGGTLLHQGHTRVAGQGEYVDDRNFLPYPGQIEDVHYPSGVHVIAVEPLKAIRHWLRTIPTPQPTTRRA